MKTKRSKLPHLLKWLFLIFEVITGLACLGVALLAIFATHFYEGMEPDQTNALTHIEVVTFSLPENAVSIEFDGAPAEGVSLVKTAGAIAISNPEIAAQYIRKIRVSVICFVLFIGAVSTAICEFFRRFFRSVDQANTFSSQNVKNIHKIGLLFIVGTIGLSLFNSWIYSNASEFYQSHFEATGIALEHLEFNEPSAGIAIRQSESGGGIRFKISGIVVGLMFLALGEAFRQGLALKEENELTV